jgi:endogenous inhibitor of DNA gyrase (YacG/DUF329 family)
MTGQAKCPICGKPQEQKWRPFCSRRCADVDLSRWLKGSYGVPAEEPLEGLDDEDEEPTSPRAPSH